MYALCGLLFPRQSSISNTLFIIFLSLILNACQTDRVSTASSNKPGAINDERKQLDISVNLASDKTIMDTVSFTKSEYSYSLGKNIVRYGSVSQRFEIRHGDCGEDMNTSDCNMDRQRVERLPQYKYIIEKPGYVTWYGFSVYIPSEFKDITPSNTCLAQVKFVGRREPLWQMNAGNGKVFLHFNGSGTDCDIGYLKDMRQKWTDISLGIDYETRSGVGYFNGSYVQLWVNGEKIGCSNGHFITENMIRNKKKKNANIYFRYGIYNSYVSRWLDKNKTKYVSYKTWIDKHADSGLSVSTVTNKPFVYDWGVKLPTQVVYFDEMRFGGRREDVDVNLIPAPEQNFVD